jgi:hypothetical protein
MRINADPDHCFKVIWNIVKKYFLLQKFIHKSICTHLKRVLKSDIVVKVGSEAGQPELLHALLQLQRAQYVLHNLKNKILFNGNRNGCGSETL